MKTLHFTKLRSNHSFKQFQGQNMSKLSTCNTSANSSFKLFNENRAKDFSNSYANLAKRNITKKHRKPLKIHN